MALEDAEAASVKETTRRRFDDDGDDLGRTHRQGRDARMRESRTRSVSAYVGETLHHGREPEARDRFNKAAAVHVVILTLNEAMHIARCIESVLPVATSVTVVDSGSTDGTVAIARECGAEVITNPFINHAMQMNFAILRLEQRGGWVFRIDADEVLDALGRESLLSFLQKQPIRVAGVALRRQIYFMGQRIRWGGLEPSWQLRLFRAGRGRCEDRWMDEHIIVDGDVVRSDASICDMNLKSLAWWTEKHNGYATREAVDLLTIHCHPFQTDRPDNDTRSSPGARLKRVIKNEFYAHLPLGLRAAAYFFVRYVLMLGFLDGKAGFFFHFLQALWYRTLVDAKVLEITKHAERSGVPLLEAIRERTGLDVKPRAERDAA